MPGLKIAGFAGGTGLGCGCCATGTSCDCADFIFNSPDLFITDSEGTHRAIYNGTFGRWFTCCLSASVPSVTGTNNGILDACHCTTTTGSVPYVYSIDFYGTGTPTLCGDLKLTRYWPVLYCTTPDARYHPAQGDCHTNTCPAFSGFPTFSSPAADTCPLTTQLGSCGGFRPYYYWETARSEIRAQVTACTPDIAWSGTPAVTWISCVPTTDVLSGSVTIST